MCKQYLTVIRIIIPLLLNGRGLPRRNTSKADGLFPPLMLFRHQIEPRIPINPSDFKVHNKFPSNMYGIEGKRGR